MAHYEENLVDEWDAGEAEGQSEAYDEMDELDEVDELDEGDDMDELDELDEGDEMDALDEGDEGDFWDEYDEADEFGEESSMDEALAFAPAAEDSDEFFRRLARVARRVVRTAATVARRAAPIVGRVARAAAPIVRAIPHPAAQIAGRVAGVLGQLRMEGASEEDALEAMSELAARNRAVAPIAAAVAARALMRQAAATAPAAHPFVPFARFARLHKRWSTPADPQPFERCRVLFVASAGPPRYAVRRPGNARKLPSTRHGALPQIPPCCAVWHNLSRGAAPSWHGLCVVQVVAHLACPVAIAAAQAGVAAPLLSAVLSASQGSDINSRGGPAPAESPTLFSSIATFWEPAMAAPVVLEFRGKAWSGGQGRQAFTANSQACWPETAGYALRAFA